MAVGELSTWNLERESSAETETISSHGDSEIEVGEDVLEFTDIVGGYGPWQRNLFVLLFLASIPSTWQNLMITFMAPNMDYWCARPPEVKSRICVSQWRNLTSPQLSLDRCHMISNWNDSSDERTIIKCTSWEYNTSFYQSTIVNEWDLVCDKEWLVSLSKSIYNVGYLVAVLFFGQLSDSLGRRPMLLISFVISVTAGVLSTFSTSYAMFAVLRFFNAVGNAGFFSVSFVLLVEIVSPENRPMVGIAIYFGWCLAFISLPGIAWIVRDWFWLQLAVSLPKLLFFPVFWLVPESPRWLLIQGKEEEFRKLLSKASAKNGNDAEETDKQICRLLSMSEKEHTKESKNSRATVFDLLKTPELRKNTLNLFYNWLVNSFIYYGLTYNTEDLAGDVYLNFFASGALEFPAYLIAIYITKRMGRRLPLTFGMIAGGVACAATIPIPNELYWLQVAFSLTGKFFITATFATVYVYSSEIFPTVVRNVGVSTGSTFARVGSIISPFVRELATTTAPAVPQAIYAVLSVSSGLLVLLLPETNNARFTNTLEEAERFGRNAKVKSSLHGQDRNRKRAQNERRIKNHNTRISLGRKVPLCKDMV